MEDLENASNMNIMFNLRLFQSQTLRKGSDLKKNVFITKQKNIKQLKVMEIIAFVLYFQIPASHPLIQKVLLMYIINSKYKNICFIASAQI